MNLFESILNEACSDTIEERFTIKGAKAFIGDICYALKDDIYQGVWGKKLDFKDGLIRTNGTDGEICAVVGGTAYGDGSYTGDDGFEYGVDAGVIGVVSSDYFREDVDGGQIVELPDGEATVYFRDDHGDFDITITSKDGNVLYNVSIPTHEEEKFYCQNCGDEISEWEDRRYGGRCESCYFGEDEEDEEYEDDE